MNLAMLLLTIAAVILAGLSFWAAVHYGRKAVSEAKSANALANERSHVKWQAGRLRKDNAGRFYLLNIGQDPAHEVTVVAWTSDERTEATAPVVRPYFPEEDLAADPPPYVEFRLPEREQNGPKPESGPRLMMPPEGSIFAEEFEESQREINEMIEERQRQQVGVRVTWRSALGRWSTKELQTG